MERAALFPPSPLQDALREGTQPVSPEKAPEKARQTDRGRFSRRSIGPPPRPAVPGSVENGFPRVPSPSCGDGGLRARQGQTGQLPQSASLVAPPGAGVWRSCGLTSSRPPTLSGPLDFLLGLFPSPCRGRRAFLRGDCEKLAQLLGKPPAVCRASASKFGEGRSRSVSSDASGGGPNPDHHPDRSLG